MSEYYYDHEEVSPPETDYVAAAMSDDDELPPVSAEEALVSGLLAPSTPPVPTATFPLNASIIVDYEAIAKDAKYNLNCSNGKTFQRKPGVHNVHDGQIMIRLKKRRYVVLDYGYVPNEEDVKLAQENAQIFIPDGAGVQKCNGDDCSKVGVPVML